jgi:sugar lactone lactonase YvrE
VEGVTVGADGRIYVADSEDDRVLVVDRSGKIKTVAGGLGSGYSGDGGPALKAALYGPVGLTLGPDGSLYIADSWNQRVRRVDGRGIITTVAGNGSYGYSHDGVPARAAALKMPGSVAVAPDGSLYIADSNTYRIRKVCPGR